MQLSAISFTLKYELAIPLEKKAENRINLFVLSVLNMLFINGVLSRVKVNLLLYA